MQAVFTPDVKQVDRKLTHKTPNLSINLEQLNKPETESKEKQPANKVTSPASSNKQSKKSSLNTAKDDAQFLKYLRDQNKQKQIRKQKSRQKLIMNKDFKKDISKLEKSLDLLYAYGEYDQFMKNNK